MDPINYSALLLGTLGAMALAAASETGILPLLLFVSGSALGVLFGGSASAESIGLLAAVTAAVLLLRPHWIALAAPVAGMLVGLSAMLVRTQLSIAVVYPLVFAMAPPIVVTLLKGRANFAPPALRDEALAFIAMFGALVAAVPGIASGWRSALALNVAGAQPLPIPGWVFALAATSVALGGVYSIWRRAN